VQVWRPRRARKHRWGETGNVLTLPRFTLPIPASRATVPTGYLFVIFVLFPLVIWTGLAMSPAIASAFPAAVTVLGGQQSARTIHFFVSVFLLLLVHVGMVSLTGFRNRMRAMITGRPATNMELR
jgi:hypothetical protein